MRQALWQETYPCPCVISMKRAVLPPGFPITVNAENMIKIGEEVSEMKVKSWGMRLIKQLCLFGKLW